MRSRTRRLAAAVLIAAFASVHCGGGDPVSRHRENAFDLLAKGQTEAALIEFSNAVKLAPEDPQLNFEVGQALAALGRFSEARFFFDEAYRLDPTFSEAAVRLASLMSGGDPAAARSIITRVLAARPDDAWGHLGLAQLQLEAGDTSAALASAEAAIASSPELPEAHAQLARVHQARIAEHFSEHETTPPDAEYEAALAALERARELGNGTRPWRETIERARILSLWPGHEAEADASFRQAYEEATRGGAQIARRRAAERAIEYAQRTRNGDLLGWGFARLVELRPYDTESWESLAQNTANRGGSFEEVLRTRTEQHPEDSGAHVSLAAHLLDQQGLAAAEQYLNEQIAIGRSQEQAADLLAATVRLQLKAGEQQQALATARRLSGEYPDSKAAIIMAAWLHLQRLQPGLAIGILAEQEWAPKNVEALTLLVDSQSMLGNVQGELAALSALLENIDPESMLARRIEARIAHHQGEYQRAAGIYQRLRKRRVPLAEPELIWFARSAYGANLDQLGRSILLDMVERKNPSLSATAEFARREYAHPRRRRVARKAFDLILAEQPTSRRAVGNAADLEILSGEPERALARFDAAIAAEAEDPKKSVDLRVRRAETLEAMGRHEEARKEAWTAFELRPEYPRALPVLVSLYADEADQEIARRGATIGGGLSPTEHAFVGRLHELAGNERLARWSFEQALNGGVDIPILRNDLAYLLAKQKTDLDRARLLAQQAAQRLGDAAPVADTLGYVELASGNAAEAERAFQRAIDLAAASGQPTSQYRFHLALAMRDLGKISAAERTIGELLADDPDFAEADEAERALRQMGRERDREKRTREREKRLEERKARLAAEAAARAEAEAEAEAGAEAARPEVPGAGAAADPERSGPAATPHAAN